MAREKQPTAFAFGKLVRQKLAERGWSQRRLAQTIFRVPSYISYVIRGENPSARGGRLGINHEVVMEIATALRIPVNEAFESAGLDPSLARRSSVEPPTSAAGHKPAPDKGVPEPGSDASDIASDGDVNAPKLQDGEKAGGNPAKSARTLTIDLADGARITLDTGPGNVTEDEKARYALALRVAYECIRQTT